MAIALLLTVVVGCSDHHDTSALRIGVMLPLTGPDTLDARDPLSWAAANINAGGGVDGRPIQFVYRDLGREPVFTVAKDFVSDPSVAAVIGPANSEDAMRVVSMFFQHHKVIVTPSATSADLFRAFSVYKPQYLWRPVESDIAQMRAMLQVAISHGARSVALVSGDSAYGTTFFNSFGFLAAEDGLRVTTTLRYDQEAQGCQASMDQALSSGADVVLAVPDHAEEAICMADQWRAEGSRPRLLFSDAAQEASLISTLGTKAQGLEGIGLSPDPANGFAQAFQARFHQPPTPYAANIYDSALLVAYGLVRSHGHTGASLAKAIQEVVDGKNPARSWDASGVAQTLAALRRGKRPVIDGAVGPWKFDKDSGIELVASTYELWQVKGQQLAVVDYLSTASAGTARQGLSEAKTAVTPDKAATNLGGSYRPPPKTGTWALLVAASDGWGNYRHQADVLAQYQQLRAGGVPADHIIVVSADDLADNPQNPKKGKVPYVAGGPNVDTDVPVDYPLKAMTAQKLMDILSGHVTPGTPKVIKAGPGGDIFVYIAGHGNTSGVYLGLGQPVPDTGASYSILTPQLLDNTIDLMAAGHSYRRILIAVEACQGGVLGQNLDAPGALLLSGASPDENSLSANYDVGLHTWLGDQFSYQLWKAEAAMPTASLEQLYQHLYLNVTGSHVSAYGPDFGNIATASLGEFVTQ
ncbi:MAG: ABC transporter substrate-binding protein [Acidimicrobiaceae bacterium]|nr:ABC transporter substrate-binding protein [Acidimicrobiaceae bacterium]